MNDLRRLLKHMRTATDPTSYSPIPSTSHMAEVDIAEVDIVGVTP